MSSWNSLKISYNPIKLTNQSNGWLNWIIEWLKDTSVNFVENNCNQWSRWPSFIAVVFNWNIIFNIIYIIFCQRARVHSSWLFIMASRIVVISIGIQLSSQYFLTSFMALDSCWCICTSLNLSGLLEKGVEISVINRNSKTKKEENYWRGREQFSLVEHV